MENTVWNELCERGFSLLHDKSLFSLVDDPMGLALKLFNRRPYRYQKTIIQPSIAGNRVSLPFTVHAGPLHNDCMQYGMPAQVQVMMCENQAQSGGSTILLDVWPILEILKLRDQQLYDDLFFVLRRMKPYFQTRYSLTLSLCRGNLIFFHPGIADGDAVGRSLQGYIDDSDKIEFRSVPGDIYINNNHRILHGRTAFDDQSRRFVRFLYWFLEPFPAPHGLLHDASLATGQLAERLKDASFWIKQHLGVEAPQWRDDLVLELRNALSDLISPSNSGEWNCLNYKRTRVQEAILSALWNVLCQKDFKDAEILDVCRRLREPK